MRIAPCAAALASCLPAAAQPPLDRDDLTPFVDRYFAEQLAETRIPGAAFVLVKDGEVVCAKGYGFADLERRVPVDAQTVFRVGSVSKTFTAVAAMQLVERGKLALDADVNRYLRELAVPPTWPEPVTLLQLLTHTAGFGERFVGQHAGRAGVTADGDCRRWRSPSPRSTCCSAGRSRRSRSAPTPRCWCSTRLRWRCG